MAAGQTPKMVWCDLFEISYVRKDLTGSIYTSHTHVHNAGELMLVREGRSIIFCEGRVTQATAPYVVWYPQHTPHEQENYSTTVYERWCFPLFVTDVGYADLIPKKHFVAELTAEQCELFTLYAGLLERFYRGTEDGRRHTAGSRQSALPRTVQDETRLRYLLGLFLNELGPLIPHGNDPGSEQVNAVCLYITEHPAERLTIRSLCERFYIGRTTLTALFRSRMNMSVGEFITVTRVMHAKKLLAGDLPLAEIAERCGFSTPSYMIKVFSRGTGMTPSRFRKMIKAG